MKKRLLDLFCGAGGAAKGYQQAGFYVVGVDIKAQPHYCGDEFHQADALEFCREHGREFDVIHASPPCQAYSAMRKGRWQDRDHPDLVGSVRQLLKECGKPYVIENVVGSPLIYSVMLCGSMFGLQTKDGSRLRRHRLFETSFLFNRPCPCRHNKGSVIGVYGGGQHPQRRKPAAIGVYCHSGGSSKRDYLDMTCFTVEARKDAMGIDWMVGNELSQAVPPAYTEYIGRQLMKIVNLDRRAGRRSSLSPSDIGMTRPSIATARPPACFVGIRTNDDD